MSLPGMFGAILCLMDDHTRTPQDVVGRVLVVDDERPLAQMIESYLVRAGFDVSQAHTGPHAVSQAQAWMPDVVVLDLGLPGLDGMEVCRRIRIFSDCYILMLTARNSEDDKIAGLTTGADDYITKPFSIRELVTRIRAVLRRPRVTSTAGVMNHTWVSGDLVVDPAAHEVRIKDVPIALTRTEFAILAALAAHPDKVLTRQELITDVWDTSWIGDERIIDVHIGNLRRKLDLGGAGQGYIDTIRGVGYRMGRA